MNPLVQEILDAFAAAYDPAVWGLPTIVASIGIAAGAIAAWYITRTPDTAVVDAESRAHDLDKKRSTVVEAIRALDLERDKLSAEDYERERRALLAHGADALRALEQGDSPEAAVSDPSPEALAEALEKVRGDLGDETVEALKRRLAASDAPAPPPPAPAPAPQPTIGPKWQGALWTLGVVVLLGGLFLVLRGIESPREPEMASSMSPSAQRPPQAPPLDPGIATEVAELEAALQANPTDLAALNDLTDLEIRRQQWDAAGGYNERALAVNAGDPEARTWQALLTYRGGDPINAVKMLDQVIVDAPEYGRARQFRGIIHLQIGQYEEAVAQFERALELADDDRTRVGLRQMLSEARQGLQAASGAPDLAGTITLGEGVDPSSWGPNASVFVSVKAASGPPMPLRAKKLTPGPFPLSFSLTAADAPMRGGPLPEQVIVTVKVDLDGNPMGDDAGAPKVVVDAVSPGTQDLAVTLTGS